MCHTNCIVVLQRKITIESNNYYHTRNNAVGKLVLFYHDLSDNIFSFYQLLHSSYIYNKYVANL